MIAYILTYLKSAHAKIFKFYLTEIEKITFLCIESLVLKPKASRKKAFILFDITELVNLN